tara:strand:+ start:5677 stop:6117 length:441 start_codon:yes stop_codon:yes gene_type:complete
MSDDESPRLGESPSENKFIDEITMKLLSNQSGYAKYLSKTDQGKHEEIQQFKRDCSNYKGDILSMTRELLACRDNEYGSDVNDSFNDYARTLIRYLEVKQQSDEKQREYEDEEDMFPYSIDEDNKPTKKTYGKMNTLDLFLKKNHS